MQSNERNASLKQEVDPVARSLRRISEYIFTISLGFLPLLFIPNAFVSFGYSKIFIAAAAVTISIIFFSLSVLRSGRFYLGFPLAGIALCLVVVSALASALLSGDIGDSMAGDTVSIHSVIFLVLLVGIIVSVVQFVRSSAGVMRFYFALMIAAVLIGIFHVARVLLGADTLSFGVFTSDVSTPLGNWNDLALFFGLIVILALVALEQLSLTRVGKICIGTLSVLSLFILVVVNFFYVWIVLAFVSLVVLMYVLSKDRFGINMFAKSAGTNSIPAIVLSTVVFITALLFIIGGNGIGSVVSDVTGISYVEVRPSLSATADVARGVFADNAFVGIGPNKFVDAWRLYKDANINQTLFWNVDFAAGSGYIPTWFVTTGVLGIVAWFLFLGLLVYSGIRMLFSGQDTERQAFFIGSTSFVAALYIWGMSFVYVPSATLLILGAVFTGIAGMIALSNGSRGTQREIILSSNRRTGFVLVAFIMLVIVGAVSVLYFGGQHYSASYIYAKGVSNIKAGTTLEEVEAAVAEAYERAPSSRYAREVAQYQIARINTLVGLANPNTEQQQQFQNAVANGVSASRLAVEIDPSDADNWLVLAQVYGTLQLIGIEGSYERAVEAVEQGQRLDPVNPEYPFLRAQLEIQNGNVDEGRRYVTDALRLRPRYTEAIVLLSQIDIASGNIPAAIDATIAIINLEPRNAVRYYQLGLLYSADSNVTNAIASFERAVALDANYANARYLLAIAYAETGRFEEALIQLRRVQELNPNNTQLTSAITAIEAGNFEPDNVRQDQISAPTDVNIVNEDDIDSPLLTPVNPGSVNEAPEVTEVTPVTSGEAEGDVSTEEVTEDNS